MTDRCKNILTLYGYKEFNNDGQLIYKLSKNARNFIVIEAGLAKTFIKGTEKGQGDNIVKEIATFVWFHRQPTYVRKRASDMGSPNGFCSNFFEYLATHSDYPVEETKNITEAIKEYTINKKLWKSYNEMLDACGVGK